jgi:hypothetical protein
MGGLLGRYIGILWSNYYTFMNILFNIEYDPVEIEIELPGSIVCSIPIAIPIPI